MEAPGSYVRVTAPRVQDGRSEGLQGYVPGFGSGTGTAAPARAKARKGIFPPLLQSPSHTTGTTAVTNKPSGTRGG